MQKKTIERIAAALSSDGVDSVGGWKSREGRYTPTYVSGLWMFDGMADAIASLRPQSIIDAGAGFGHCMVKSLSKICDKVWGVELDKEAVELGNAAFARIGSACKLVRGNIRTYDFSGWDLIYSYHPLRKHSDQDELDVRVMSKLQPGDLYARAHCACDLTKLVSCEIVASYTHYPGSFDWAIFRKL